MADIKIENIVENYKKLNTSVTAKDIDDLDIFSNQTKLNLAISTGQNQFTNYGETKVSSEDMVTKLDSDSNKSLSFEEFSKYIDNGYCNEDEAKELYAVISALDGTDGITAEELEFVMSYDKDSNALTKKAVANFLAAVKSEVDSAAATDSAETTVTNNTETPAATDGTGNAAASSDDAAETEEQTELNEAAAKLQKIAALYDTNGDGTISEDEISDFYNLVSTIDGADGLTTDELDYLLSKIDANYVSSLTKDSIKEIISKAQTEEDESRPKVLTTEYNDDGTLASFTCTNTEGNKKVSCDGRYITVSKKDENGSYKETKKIDLSETDEGVYEDVGYFGKMEEKTFDDDSDLAEALGSYDESDVIQIGCYLFFNGNFYYKDGQQLENFLG